MIMHGSSNATAHLIADRSCDESDAYVCVGVCACGKLRLLRGSVAWLSRCMTAQHVVVSGDGIGLGNRVIGALNEGK